MATKAIKYPDLSQPLQKGASNNYPDLSQPLQKKGDRQSPNPSNPFDMSNALQSIIGLDHSALGNVQDALYGFGKAGSNIAKMAYGQNMPNMPDIRQKNPNPVAEAIGQYAPFAVGGGGSLIGSTLGAGTYGATQFEPGQKGLIDSMLGLKPGGRVRSSIEDAIISAVTHGIGNKIFGSKQQAPTIDFKPKVTFPSSESEFTNIPFKPPSFLEEKNPQFLSEPIATELHNGIVGKREIEDSGKQLATGIKNSYDSVKAIHQKKYDTIFNKPTENESYATGEPIKVKNMPVDNGKYIEKYRDNNFPDENIQKLHDELMENKSIENHHKLQSELGSEIGYLKKQKDAGNLDELGKNKLSKYANMRDTLKQDMDNQLNKIDPKLGKQYKDATTDWENNVIPYHSDKNLKDIATGKIKNPTASQITSIFKNPEENITKVANDLTSDNRARIVHIGSGITGSENAPKNLLNARKSLEKKGLSSYIHPYYEQAFKNLRNNVESEKAIIEQNKQNEQLIEKLKKVREAEENKRVQLANARQRQMDSAKKEAENLSQSKQKEMQKSYEEDFNRKQEKKIKMNNMIRTIIGGGLGIAAVHGLKLKPEDLIGAYLGKAFKKATHGTH
jgi:hypothetical protein